jgi:hypothetical protein
MKILLIKMVDVIGFLQIQKTKNVKSIMEMEMTVQNMEKDHVKNIIQYVNGIMIMIQDANLNV